MCADYPGKQAYVVLNRHGYDIDLPLQQIRYMVLEPTEQYMSVVSWPHAWPKRSSWPLVLYLALRLRDEIR